MKTKPKDSLKDRRTQFTRSELKKTFLKLLDTEERSKITVTLLCQEANVNRGTFYAHYTTIEDLWKDIENDIYQESELIMNVALTPSDAFAQTTGESDASQFEHYLHNTEIWSKLLFSEHISMELYDRICTKSADLFQMHLSTDRLSEEERRIFSRFIIGGCMAVNKDRFRSPWRHPQESDDFYVRFTKQISEPYLK